MPNANSAPELLLSIIIPCKNEEANIARCLKSVIREVRAIKNTEILLVDSASSDRSVEIAKQFPVNIIQLKPDWVHSPAAARYLGCINTNGKYIFIIDADMELLPGFLEKAIKFIEKDDKIAGVAGMGSQVYEEGGKLNDFYRRKNKLREVTVLAGAALFRRAILENTGYFNPYLQSEEEVELAQRLRRAGFKLFSLPYPMTVHYTSQSIEKFLYRLTSGLFLGIGQMLRLSFRRGISLPTLLRLKWLFVFLCFVLTLVGINLYVFMLKNYFFLAFEVIAILLFWLSVCLVKKGFKQGCLSIFKWLAINVSIIAGILQRPKDPKTYPQDVLVMRKGIKIDHQ